MSSKTRQVIATIDENGNVTLDGVGFEDNSCSTDVGQVAGRIGGVTRDIHKPEFARTVRRAAGAAVEIKR